MSWVDEDLEDLEVEDELDDEDDDCFDDDELGVDPEEREDEDG